VNPGRSSYFTQEQEPKSKYSDATAIVICKNVITALLLLIKNSSELPLLLAH